ILNIYAYEKGEINFYLDSKNKNELIAYLPEERGLYKNVSIMDMLLYFSRLKNYPDQKAKKNILKYLKKFDLEGKEKSKIEELSKGMAQKVQFIATLIHEPKLLILDEPLSGLDPISQELFKKEIKELSKKGTTIFFSSHQINLVEELCERVYLLNEGKFIIEGNIEDIKKKYGGYSCEIRGNNIDKIKIKELSKYIDHLEKIKENELKIYLKAKITQEEIIKHFLKEEFEEFSIKRISLHEIYIKEIEKTKKNNI
ncbi:ABC transporter ATP-binding protein, partial [bacterium]|nr:ABC transporter ATP-binding protein [bacterium]